MQILLVPLDERPVNTRYPHMIAAIAGATVLLPPPSALPHRKQPADRTALQNWIRDTAPRAGASVIAIESLAYGGLITSRTSHEPAWDILRWLSVLDQVPRPLYLSTVITRVNRDDNNTEEPDYWSDYGPRLYHYSQQIGAAGLGSAVGADIPLDIRRDFLWRRARNHAITRAVLAEASRFDLLVIASDDTNPRGLPARERAALAELRDWLGLGDRVLMYPGADELACTLTARLLNRGRTIKVFVDYAVPGGDAVTAKYEDRPVRETVAGQLQAVGGRLAASPADADLILLVNPPSEAGQEWDLVDRHHERDQRSAPILEAVRRVRRAIDSGQRVAIADVAYPNGADPILMDYLLAEVPLADLAAYGGWNTAGNTLGSVLAAATVPQVDDSARRAFLAHRLLEDWGYQHSVRSAVRATYGDTEAQHLDAIQREIAGRLADPLRVLAEHGLDYDLTGVTLPWQRTFEVDFTLRPRS